MLSAVRVASDVGSPPSDTYTDQTAHFPHTRALLAHIARQHRPLDSYESDVEGDDFTRVPSVFVTRVVSLLDREHEDELKGLLRDHYVGIDDDALEQHVLDLMHKHRDDIAGVPFIFLAQNKRIISRPSSRASSHSARLNRPETPLSAPSSPLAYVFRRPHTPLASPLSTGQGSYTAASAPGDSPSASPVLPYSLPQSYFATSLPASPLSSPRLLNAKASEFRPHPRPLSAASSNPGTFIGSRAETPSPDLWAHNSSRATSNLAIAAPLLPDSSLLSRSGTPSSLRASIRPDEYDEDNDPFDPFGKDMPVFPSILASDYEPVWEHPVAAPSFELYNDSPVSDFPSMEPLPHSSPHDNFDDEASDLLTSGMTPFDVLASVFGSSLAPSELEEALANNGYDFERAVAWLIDRMSPSQANHSLHHSKAQNVGDRVSIVSRDGVGPSGFVRGGRSAYSAGGPRGGTRFGGGRPTSGGNRVCRYFLAGECLRADCRFSHDLERALCRFWLRGTCAKGETCEFLHHLPKDIDVSILTGVMAQANIRANGSGDAGPPVSPPPDDFPSLEDGGRRVGGAYYGRNGSHYDPSRTRFSAAVKKSVAAASPFQPRDPATIAARREAMGSAADSLHHRTAIVAPKPSPRLKLRAPTLLPTLPTGESVNQLYMNYRARALQLGAARSACLSRAADAWRRGDGAAAKRFSREGHDLNAKMRAEMTQAASTLVRERALLAEQAVKARDPSWSDDPGDRTARGQPCGAGLGVVLGIASTDLVEDRGKLSPEERTEVVLDLHALHSNEAVEVLEEFLLALERDHFYGLVYLVVGEEKHTGTQNVARGASRARLAAGVREWLHRWGYPWSERDGVICVDHLTHL
ncbi:hypothetical protein K488DRAFT_59564 [Vararia minispora EC-137]|uniref:Uncharacterized protein n=1 Tax=Vararia minispora EC-137 TaxID=1314806 RepID=A0ACB8Q929_9AGAM|nr:hypothetical protein K488DRAFT_59564 [Vararia minispora EC-137]